MVFKATQSIFETALATFVIDDRDRKSGRSNQESEVKTTYRTMSAFQTNEHSRLSQLVPFALALYFMCSRTRLCVYMCIRMMYLNHEQGLNSRWGLHNKLTRGGAVHRRFCTVEMQSAKSGKGDST
jgi:hypothetical protein